MISTDSFVDNLDRQVRVLCEASSPSEVFKGLLEGALLAVPRASIFLIRQGQLKGWGCVGYSPEAARGQRAFGGPLDRSWLDELVSGNRTHLEQPGGGGGPDFGQQPAAETIAFAIRLKERPIAVVVAERSAGEQPWQFPILHVLVRVAHLRLELDLLRRKVDGARPGTPTRGGAPAAADKSEAAPSATDAGDLEAARRYAKLVATDIRLYNEEAVVQGRRDGDLADRLGIHLKRGKTTFVARHGELGDTAIDVLLEAYVEVLAGGKTELLPRSCLD